MRAEPRSLSLEPVRGYGLRRLRRNGDLLGELRPFGRVPLRGWVLLRQLLLLQAGTLHLTWAPLTRSGCSPSGAATESRRARAEARAERARRSCAVRPCDHRLME